MRLTCHVWTPGPFIACSAPALRSEDDALRSEDDGVAGGGAVGKDRGTQSDLRVGTAHSGQECRLRLIFIISDADSSRAEEKLWHKK